MAGVGVWEDGFGRDEGRDGGKTEAVAAALTWGPACPAAERGGGMGGGRAAGRRRRRQGAAAHRTRLETALLAVIAEALPQSVAALAGAPCRGAGIAGVGEGEGGSEEGEGGRSARRRRWGLWAARAFGGGCVPPVPRRGRGRRRRRHRRGRCCLRDASHHDRPGGRDGGDWPPWGS